MLLLLIPLLLYTYVIPRGTLSNADAHIALTAALVDDHTLTIDHFIARYVPDLADRAAAHGHYYTDKAPGLSLLALPAYGALRLALPPAFFSRDLFFIVRYLLTSVVLGLPAAVFVVMLWRFFLPVLGCRRAVFPALGYGAGTMAWALSALLYSHVVAAMALLGAFMLLFPLSTSRGSGTRSTPLGWWRWPSAGALCGLAVLCEYPAALVAALFALFAVHAAVVDVAQAGPFSTAPRLLHQRPGYGRRLAALQVAGRVALFVGAGAALLLPLPLYNIAVYGSPLAQGYAHLHGNVEFIGGMRHGVEGIGLPALDALWGITFSPYRGLFVLSPFLLLAVPGLAAMWARPRLRPAALLCAGAVAMMLLFNSAYYFWDGGSSLGPRHMTPALPFLLVPVAYALRRPRTVSLAARLGPWLVGVSMAIVTLCCVTVLIFLPLDGGGSANPILDVALPALLHGHVLNNWGVLLFGLRGTMSLLPLALAEALLTLALWRTLRPPRDTRHRAGAGTTSGDPERA